MATEKRVAYTLKNVIWKYIYILVSSILPFIIRSLIIKFWGMNYLGINSICTSILQVLNISELGIGQALIINMYKPAARGDVKKVNSLLMLYKWFYWIIGIAVAIIGLILIFFLPYIVKGNGVVDINVTYVYLLYLLQSVVGYFAFPYSNAIFIANQESEKIDKYQTFVWLIVYTLQIFVLCLGNSYYHYVCLLPFATLMCGVINRFGMKKWYPDYHADTISRNDFDKGFWNSFIKQMAAMALSKLRTVFRNSIDSIVISTVMGVVMVAKYQNYMLILTVPLMLIGSLTAGILPSLGNGMAVETKESNLAVIRLVAFVLQWFGTIFATFLMCFYQPFMLIWTAGESMLSDVAMVMFVIYFYLRVISEISILIRNCSGVWWEGKEIPVIETLTNLVLNIIFSKIWGIEGVLLATIISMLLINIPLETYCVYKYYFEKKPWDDLKDYLRNGIIAMAAIAMTYIISRQSQGSGVSLFIVWTLECIAVPSLMWLIFNRKSEQLKGLIDIIKQIIYIH